MSVFACKHDCLSVSLSVYLYGSICISICLFVCLCLSVCLAYVSICLSTCLFICMCVCRSGCLVYLSVYLSMHLYICFYVCLYTVSIPCLYQAIDASICTFLSILLHFLILIHVFIFLLLYILLNLIIFSIDSQGKDYFSFTLHIKSNYFFPLILKGGNKACEGFLKEAQLLEGGFYALKSVGCWTKGDLILREPLLPLITSLKGAELKTAIVKVKLCYFLCFFLVNRCSFLFICFFLPIYLLFIYLSVCWFIFVLVSLTVFFCV